MHHGTHAMIAHVVDDLTTRRLDWYLFTLPVYFEVYIIRRGMQIQCARGVVGGGTWTGPLPSTPATKIKVSLRLELLVRIFFLRIMRGYFGLAGPKLA